MQTEEIDKKNYFIIALVGVILIVIGHGIGRIGIIYSTIPAVILEYIGLGFLTAGLLYGAIRDEKLSPNVRLGMVIAVGLIIGLKLMSYSYSYYGYGIF